MKDIVVLDGVRTAIGTFGGSLSGTSPIELGSIVAKEALARSGVEGKQVPVEDTIRGFKEILEGKHDDVAENNFYMKGSIDEALGA